jgi:succinate-semialdehyde dehydrogenase/glutarate-semialdehyde dehydrogenase
VIKIQFEHWVPRVKRSGYKLISHPSVILVCFSNMRLYTFNNLKFGIRSATKARFVSNSASRNANNTVVATDALLSRVKDTTLLPLGKQDASPSSYYSVYNPATDEHLAQIIKCGGKETSYAIKAAADAFPSWSLKYSAKDRCKLLWNWYHLCKEARDDITTLMTLESGKPLAESRGEFDLGIESITWFAEEARRSGGDIFESPDPKKRYLTIKQPVGVVAAITPWNFPFSMITRKVAPAIAVGCTVVLKPAELTPLTAIALSVLAIKAGIPTGVFNIVSGDATEIGTELMASSLVRKFSFTGSTGVGKLLLKQSADTVKKASLELGGNAPFLVFKDANIKKAALDVATSSYRNAGQTCICTNRVLVDAAVADQFTEALLARVEKYKLGDGMETGTTMGPLISDIAVGRVEDKVREAVEDGAQCIIGGSRPSDLSSSIKDGYFYQPTILTNVHPKMNIAKEEIFGPVTPVMSFKDENEMIKAANDTQYGLAAYAYTNDLARAWRVAEALEYGQVGINEVNITNEIAPFGGVKESGLGREHSKYGLGEFQEIKSIVMGLNY